MVLKLYYDLMSQPARVLFILLKYAKSGFQSKPIRLATGEHFSSEFAAINRFKKVPVIDHNGFILTESVAIIRYLSKENIVPDNLYPRTTKEQARIDEYMEWQHIGLRLHCTMFFLEKYLKPIVTKQQADPKALKTFEKNMVTALETFENNWLGKGTEFVSGNTITVADLLAACELEQLRLAGYNATDKFEKIRMWLPKVQQYFNPYYNEAHFYLNKIVEQNKEAE